MSRPVRVQRNVRAVAERILALRDHGRVELGRKLRARGFEDGQIDELLDRLQKSGLLNDENYAEELARGELARGHGLDYIRAKLRRRGIVFSPPSVNLEEEAESLTRFMKKKRISPASLTRGAERARILRFLRGRGFTSASIAAAGREPEDEERLSGDRMEAMETKEGDAP